MQRPGRTVSLHRGELKRRQLVRPAKAETDMPRRDRLSALSDDLLHRVLGSLDARQAVGQCSLLSRRWRHVWASMPRVTLSGLASERFGNNLLLLREDAKLAEFCLHSSHVNHTDLAHQRRWLRHVASRGVRVLDIMLVSGYHFELHDCVFNCATLEEMSVSALTVKEVVTPKSVCLPRLKKLRLHYMQLSDPSMAEKLNSGCPALEDLNLSRCLLGLFKISSGTLKTLSVTACDYSEIHVSTPNVVSLRLTVAGRVKLDGMPSLLNAGVYVSSNGLNPHAVDRHDFLDALCDAEHLELFRFDLLLKDMMDKPDSDGPTFSKLKSLYLGEWFVADFFRPFAYFLDRAPNLAALTLDQWKLYQENISGQVSIWEKPNGRLNQTSGLSSHLEMLRLRISKGNAAGEFSTLRRLLKEKTNPKETEVVWF